MSVPMFASSLQADENADAFMLGMNFFYDPDSFESPAVLALRQDTAKSLRRLGARISTEYDKDATTHVVLMTTQGGAEAMLCKRAIKDRKRVVSWSWIEACIHKGELVPIDDCVLYHPPPTLDGHPDMANVRVCVTGYTGERRQQLIDMCKSLGCEYMRVLDRKSTHLVCYEFEGAKWAKANQTGLQRIVSHRWLEECLRQWKRLDETPYTTHSGREEDEMAETDLEQQFQKLQEEERQLQEALEAQRAATAATAAASSTAAASQQQQPAHGPAPFSRRTKLGRDVPYGDKPPAPNSGAGGDAQAQEQNDV